MMAILVLCVSAVLIAIDQVLKLWVLNSLSQTASVLLIPGLLQLTYVENRGAAFGILQGRVGILSLVTMAVLLGLVIAVLMGKFKHKLVLWCMGLVIAGGAGNLIDRIARGFVVDYLDISPLFQFPVFNFADCCVVIGTGVLLVYVLFFEGKTPKATPEPLAVLPETEVSEDDSIG